MKKFYLLTNLIIIFQLSFGTKMQGQEYINFPTKNAFWSAMHCEVGTFVPKSGLVKVGVLGDTLINSKIYHKLYLQRKYVNNNPSCDTCGFVFDIDSAFYFICYREENKIIYFVPQQNGFDDPPGKEYPVFDFNLSNVGETIVGYEYVFIPFGTTYNPIPTPGCGAMQDTVTLTVKSIDRVLMSDGSYRRRINFEPLTYGREESWIEGIGSTKGFGFSLDITNSNNSMVCFSHDGKNLESTEILSSQLCNFHPDSVLSYDNKCEYTTANSIDELQTCNDISVFPNPVSETATMTYIIDTASMLTISITNSLGENISNIIDNQFVNPGNYSLLIDSRNLQSGVYYCTIKTEFGSKTIKFIVIKQSKMN
ncbi:MAG: T9SS type A sorting domain-containing protein [bacterium]